MNRFFVKMKEFEEYCITKKGNIYSLKNKQYIKHDHKNVILYKNGKKYNRSINKLIRMNFN